MNEHQRIVAGDLRRAFRRRSAEDLRRQLAEPDGPEFYRRLLTQELERREREGK